MSADEVAVAQVPIHEALAAVMRDVSAVGKDGWNEGQGFNFRGIDSLLNAIGPAFRTHGIVVVPEVTESEHGAHMVEAKGNNNSTYTKVTYFARVRVTYHFYGPEGDSLAVGMVGEALDSYDKATTKALSQAFKYALVQMLALPTHEPDPDGQNPGADDPPRQGNRPANRPAKKAAARSSVSRETPKPKITAEQAKALTLAMDDVVNEERRKEVKMAFVGAWAKPVDLFDRDLNGAWAWLALQLEMSPHPFTEGDDGVCTGCGTYPLAPWHTEAPSDGPGGPTAGSRAAGGAQQARGADEGATGHTAGANYSEEWIEQARKADLVAACADLALDQGGSVLELRERLVVATQPFA